MIGSAVGRAANKVSYTNTLTPGIKHPTFSSADTINNTPDTDPENVVGGQCKA